MTLSGSEAAALQKAQALGGAARVRQVRDGVYEVPSASEPATVYLVTGVAVEGSSDQMAYACTCPAGQHGRPCWHVASVRLWWEQQERQAQQEQGDQLGQRPSKREL